MNFEGASDIQPSEGSTEVQEKQGDAGQLPNEIGGENDAEKLPGEIGGENDAGQLPNEIGGENDVQENTELKTENMEAKSTKGLEGIKDTDVSDYPSTYKERLDRTPSETSEKGDYTGERGESTFIPSDTGMQTLLEQFGLNGIDYKDGIPDFSKCSECTVKIDNMTDNRYRQDGNFAQCDVKCAEQWNKERKDDKTDWTARDVQQWRRENGYSWHERNDMKTCDLVPTKINDYFSHLGGVAECKKRNAQNIGGEFDE